MAASSAEPYWMLDPLVKVLAAEALARDVVERLAATTDAPRPDRSQ